ncbi:MAG TPA: PAS domain-containing protein [Fibrobacteria bacterium]|nr:PAS domain-containing protein [Fibrobacteria bacterium]
MVSERALPSPEALLECSADGFALLDRDGLPLYINPAGLRLLGLASPAPGDFLDRIHQDDRDHVRAAFTSALASSGASYRVDFRVDRRSHEGRGFDRGALPGPSKRLEAHVTRSRGEDGQTWLVLNLRETGEAAHRERSGKVTAELPTLLPYESAVPAADAESLRTKGRLLDMLLDNLPLMACRLDAEGVFLESRGAALRAVGLRDNEVVGESALEGWPQCRHLLERALRGESVHFEYEHGQGERKRVQEIWFTPDPVNGGTIGFGVDITERKRVEEELSNSEAFGRRIIESSRDCIMVLNPQGTLLSISHSGRRLMEIEDPEAFISRSWMDFWRGEDRGKAENAVRAAMRTGVGKFQGYCPSVTGKPKWWDVIITPILNPAWEPERLLAVCRDITEHKRFEESLRRAKEQSEAILRAISDSVVVADSTGRVVFANDAAARLLGMASAQEILDTSLENLAAALSARDEAGAPVTWPSMAAAMAAETGTMGLESPGPAGKVLRLEDRQGSGERWLVAGSAAIRDGEGRVHLVIASAYDFTERKLAEEALHRSEEQLRQSQKMEAVGRLAGGVAHDFNNLLTAINGYSELLTRSMRETDPMQATVAEIRRAGERAASLTRQLLTFSRRQVLASRMLDLNQVVGEIRQMLGRLIGEDIQLATTGDAALAKINMDPGQMEQVILNLALNARDAMPRGGRLLIETANTRLDKGQAGTFFTVDPGRYVRLTVADTGLGMSDEVKAHLFEPFFTTKPPGQGTGLGLSTVYGIVKTAGGNISVASEVGKGTSFSVYLPAADQPKPGKDADAAKPARGTRAADTGKETILLVEDEDMVRRLIGQVLLAHGYNVLEAGSGAAALEVVDRHPAPIDLLLTDVVMAGMSGRELSEKLLVLRPGLKVLYMSGYTDDAILRHGVFQNSAAFLGKPFSPGTLVRKLREVIDGGETPAAHPSAASSASSA